MRKNIVWQLEDGRELEGSVEIFRGRVRFRIWLVYQQVIIDLMRRDYSYTGPIQLVTDGQNFAAEFAEMTGRIIPQAFVEELAEVPVSPGCHAYSPDVGRASVSLELPASS